MSNISLWFQTVFETPEAILCLVYFFVRLIFFFSYTLPKQLKDKKSTVEVNNEVKDIYVATAQLYELIKKEKENEKIEKP